MQLLAKGEKKFNVFGPGHITEMAAMPIYCKNLKKNHLRNHWGDFLDL